MKKSLALSALAALATSLLVSSPANANSPARPVLVDGAKVRVEFTKSRSTDQLATSRIQDRIKGHVPADAPQFDTNQTLPGPNDLTWDEVPTAPSGTGDFRQSPSSSGKAAAAKAGPACRVNTGNVYKRKSGGKYKYGTVGGHPTTVCTTPMVIIKHTTTMYKTTWWGLQHQGNFTGVGSAFGATRYEQKNVAVICKDYRKTTFKMVVASSGTAVGGGSSGAWAYELGENLECGTP